ncbi:MAG: hypothetical protein M1548_03915 [Actinobacteria bacterium]|nr:hypothetical protein [Actinomycetota bacterium]
MIMKASPWRIWLFRIAFLYSTAVLLVLLLSSFQLKRADLRFASDLPGSVVGILLPLLFTAGLSFLLSLRTDLDEMIPFKMACGVLSVAAVYTWGRWAASLNYGALAVLLRNPFGMGAVAIPIITLLTFLPMGAVIYFAVVATLGPDLIKIFSAESETQVEVAKRRDEDARRID